MKEDGGRELAERAVGDLVSAVIDGKLVSWTNQYAGPGIAMASPSPVAVQDELAITSTPTTTTQAYAQNVTPSSPPAAYKGATPSSIARPSATTASSPASSGTWTRQAYYNAEDGIAQGLTFLNHFGGAKGIPGTADGGPA